MQGRPLRLVPQVVSPPSHRPNSHILSLCKCLHLIMSLNFHLICNLTFANRSTTVMPSQVQTLQLLLLQSGKLEKSALKIKINFAHERILSLLPTLAVTFPLSVCVAR